MGIRYGISTTTIILNSAAEICVFNRSSQPHIIDVLVGEVILVGQEEGALGDGIRISFHSVVERQLPSSALAAYPSKE